MVRRIGTWLEEPMSRTIMDTGKDVDSSMVQKWEMMMIEHSNSVQRDISSGAGLM